MRPLNDLENRVLSVARTFEGDWTAGDIQFRGFPEEGTRYACVRLGISAAIQTLKRRGLVVNFGYRYRLTKKSAEVN